MRGLSALLIICAFRAATLHRGQSCKYVISSAQRSVVIGNKNLEADILDMDADILDSSSRLKLVCSKVPLVD